MAAAQEQVEAPAPSSNGPVIIGFVVVIILCLIGYFAFSKPAVPPIKPPTTPGGVGVKPAGPAAAATVDAVADPNSPTGYVDSGGNIVNQDGSDYTGDDTYVNSALAAFSKKLGY